MTAISPIESPPDLEKKCMASCQEYGAGVSVAMYHELPDFSLKNKKITLRQGGIRHADAKGESQHGKRIAGKLQEASFLTENAYCGILI